MAFIEEAALEGECFKDAVQQICLFLQVENLFEDQLNAIKSFLKGNNIYLCASTGYGKSIVFQSILLFFDILLDQLIGTSTAIIVCPLLSLMFDQVNKMNELGISSNAVFQGHDDEVFTSHESMLASKRWEKMWKSESFVDNCVCIAVDEAHCISQW